MTQGQPIPDQSQSLIDLCLLISAPDQSLIEPTSALDQPCDSSPSGTGSQATSTCPGTSHRGSVPGLASLGDKNLYMFPHEPLNDFGGVPLGDAAFGNVE
jgi:hypothetical protein